MIEQQTALRENLEKERNASFRVTVIGPACSGKTTILSIFDHFHIPPSDSHP